MVFPQTRHSLIQRLVLAPTEADWQEFVHDYWSPICRFALRSAPLTVEDAEDVTSETFLILLRKDLLARWMADRSSKLRTLLCGVVRNLLANRARVETGRKRLLEEKSKDPSDLIHSPILTSADAAVEDEDSFYGAWVEEMLQRAAESLLAYYHSQGKGDHFRVLYGHWCEGMTLPEIAQALNMTRHQTRHAYRHARRALAQRLQRALRDHVQRYCADQEAEQEFQAEWIRLREHVRARGGLEHAVRQAYASQLPPASGTAKDSVRETLSRITEHFQGGSDS
jgi:RNA polymerase sigma factor (sigma-70 family)